MSYSGVDNVGLVDNYAFISADLQLLTLNYELLQFLQTPICGSYITVESNGYNNFQNQNDDLNEQNERLLDQDGQDEDDQNNDGNNENDDGQDDDGQNDDGNGQNDDAEENVNDDAVECPADGVYEFQIPYALPTEESDYTWLATGWHGLGKVAIYSEANNYNSLIGFCELKFATLVTPVDAPSPILSNMPIPSAKMVSIGVLVLFGCMILACACKMTCGRSKKEYNNDDNNSKFMTSFAAMT